MHPAILSRVACPTLAALLGSFLAAGCGSRTEDAKVAETAPPVILSKESRPAEPEAGLPGLKPFREAVVHEVPEGEHRPPDATVNGKSVGKLYEQIAGRDGAPGLFDQVRFLDARGRKIKYHAVLKTDLGDIRIELLGEAAPNHVRSFVALARAGYYDGLPFHKSVKDKLGDKDDAYIEAGCPLGTGELGHGSIGYWLKPELSVDVTHEEGAVGAWHGLARKADQPGTFEDLDNAACKFYVGLTKSPWRDLSFTIFGKTVQGLDVAHKINQRPNHAGQSVTDLPCEPVRIRAVIIEELPAAPEIARRD